MTYNRFTLFSNDAQPHIRGKCLLKLAGYEVLDLPMAQLFRGCAFLWPALVAPRRPDALYQVIREWEITLEEIELAGDDLPDILQAREEVRSGIGMTPDELHTCFGSRGGVYRT